MRKESTERSSRSRGLDLVKVVVVRPDVVKLDFIVVWSVRICVVDFSVLGQLSVGLQTPSLVCVVFEDDVGLIVLVISESHQNNVRRIDPDLFPEFPSDVAKSFGAVETHGLQSTVTQHFDHLGVLLSILLEHQLSLL